MLAPVVGRCGMTTGYLYVCLNWDSGRFSELLRGAREAVLGYILPSHGVEALDRPVGILCFSLLS
jgi:hypothetical protein